MKRGVKPKRRGDRFDLMRAAPNAMVPPLFRPRTRVKGAESEAILQGEVNKLLQRGGDFQFRLSEHVTAKAGDWTVAGWPDSPIIIKIMPGLSILGPLELKALGAPMQPDQIDMKPILGTVVADTWEDALAYVLWFKATVEHLRMLLLRNPGPELPAKLAKRYAEND